MIGRDVSVNLSNKSRLGIAFCFASAACTSVKFIASKQAMSELSPLAFTPLWFAAASAWGLCFYLWQNGMTFPTSLVRYARPVLLMGFVNGLANLFFFTAINLGDPTLVAFFSRSATIYSVLLGAFVLGERMYNYQWAGVAIAILGTGVMTFRSGNVVLMILLITLVSNFFLAFSSMIAKKELTDVPPLVLATARTAIMAIMTGVLALLTNELTLPTLSTTWLWIFSGALIAPFLSYIFFYSALRYTDLAKAVVIRATQPLFVAIYGLILFGTLITAQQFLGGLLMLIGVIFMLWERRDADESLPIK